MNREELKKLIVGPIATVPTPFDADFQVDFGRMYELTQWWVENGLVKGKAVIKVAAAMGEGPQLDDWEWQRLLRTAVQAADGRATVMCGLHYKDTIRAVQDATDSPGPRRGRPPGIGAVPQRPYPGRRRPSLRRRLRGRRHRRDGLRGQQHARRHHIP